MVFNSYTFIIFFAVVLLLHNLPVSWTVKKVQLIAAGLIFYAAWNPPFVLLLLFSLITDWTLSRLIYNEQRPAIRKVYMAGTLCVNLGLLSFFKYGNFLLHNFTEFLSLFNMS